MEIRIEPLGIPDALRACETLQRALLGDRARSVWGAPSLTALLLSGGILLGACDAQADRARLSGALADLVAEIDGYPARHTAWWGVLPSARNHGAGRALRIEERRLCQESGVDLVFWELDPLRSDEAYLAFHKLGAIATGHRRDLYGEVADQANLGLATDRLHVEWWIDAPRVVSLLDHGRAAPQLRIGIHEMDVLTETKLGASGVRVLTGTREEPRSDHVLVEIPSDLDRLRSFDLAAARAWRLGCRALFEALFAKEYVGVGFLHEGGRSFHLFSKTDRRDALRDA